ncbi:trypsin-like peptidase domain-containing protein [Archangium violaceum]|uniref:trypsin-like peptidase domain-containing protein n=1 Tax=Archangium violaceum TaxID=83451 RepID=UPI00193AEB08|nr:trypsin-like peptidase domain-containing protein [Archangium violaceum]QRK11123.1 trypsin-like peptidase domain-containing protein [Archangium violaceum]
MRTVLSSAVAVVLVMGSLAGCRQGSRHQEPASAVSVPRPPQGAVMRPRFVTAEGEFAAGTAFVVRLDDGRLVGLTAYHLFGPAGGLEREVAAAELGRFVRGVWLDALTSSEQTREAGPMWVLPGAHATTDAADLSGDVAAFLVPESLAPRALKLARARPQPGERVWLFAEVLEGRTQHQLLHEARVDSSTATRLNYHFADPTLSLRATSGAPVLNARGEVVGINLGGGNDGEDSLWGAANPTESVRAQLARALPTASSGTAR